MTLSLFDLIALFLGLSAAFGWLNLRLFKLPTGVGLLIIGLAATLLLMGLNRLAPELGVGRALASVVAEVDFSKAVLGFMLAYLLFAGAMHVDLEQLKRRGWSAAVLATLGVVISAVVIGAGFWGLARLLGLGLSLPWAIVFGVLISPTDPVAVLATLKRTTLPGDIRALIEGEALFNDGVGVVLFGAAVTLAVGGGAGHAPDVAEIGLRVLVEAGGGALLGLVGGVVVIRAMRSIDDYSVEVGLTLALATVVYASAQHLHVSGPIGVVVAGLLVGNHGVRSTMSETTRRYLTGFWTLVDENFNGLLFLLLALEVFSLVFRPLYGLMGLAAIPLVVIGRWISLAGPSALLAVVGRRVSQSLVVVLTWAGVRGGISVALALSLPDSPQRSLILTATYVVVVFSVVAQSLTLERLVIRTGHGQRVDAASAQAGPGHG
jgi:CPA1 family monovalent cation:H+ antiporter